MILWLWNHWIVHITLHLEWFYLTLSGRASLYVKLISVCATMFNQRYCLDGSLSKLSVRFTYSCVFILWFYVQRSWTSPVVLVVNIHITFGSCTNSIPFGVRYTKYFHATWSVWWVSWVWLRNRYQFHLVSLIPEPLYYPNMRLFHLWSDANSWDLYLLNV